MRNEIPSDSDRLEHILQAIAAIRDFIGEMTEEQFLSDDRTQSAVLYQFVIIGEAVTSLSLELLEKYPYTWHKPRSFRNFIAHEYFGVTQGIVWYTINVQLPELEELVLKMQRSA